MYIPYKLNNKKSSQNTRCKRLRESIQFTTIHPYRIDCANGIYSYYKKIVNQ